MKTKDLITYGLIAGGVYALYWYLTNYGPSGAVSVAGGPGSYWASWFGGTTTSTSAVTGTTTTTTAAPTQVTGTTPVVTTQSSGVTTQQMATAEQVQQIQSLLNINDQLAFQAMIPTLTYAQAQTMLTNAQACITGNQALNPSSGSCYTPAGPLSNRSLTPNPSFQGTSPGGGPVEQFQPLSTGGASGSVTGSLVSGLNRSGIQGMGMIMPAPSTITQANSGVGLGDLGALPKKSPWGKLPVNQKYLN